MARGRRLGLDELMIVNPGSFRAGACLLGGDGALDEVHGLERRDRAPEVRRFFLGGDGTLYEAQPLPPNRAIGAATCRLGDEQAGIPGRFFLGEDGTVYEVMR
jgi:hypothetical protein